jgi:hypothetical protein
MVGGGTEGHWGLGTRRVSSILELLIDCSNYYLLVHATRCLVRLSFGFWSLAYKPHGFGCCLIPLCNNIHSNAKNTYLGVFLAFKPSPKSQK